jgi:hypothetical protein
MFGPVREGAGAKVRVGNLLWLSGKELGIFRKGMQHSVGSNVEMNRGVNTPASNEGTVKLGITCALTEMTTRSVLLRVLQDNDVT